MGHVPELLVFHVFELHAGQSQLVRERGDLRVQHLVGADVHDDRGQSVQVSQQWSKALVQWIARAR